MRRAVTVVAFLLTVAVVAVLTSAIVNGPPREDECMSKVTIKTELFVDAGNGPEWVDISADALNKQKVKISRGIRNEGASAAPGTLTMMLNNGASKAFPGSTGVYNPRNPLSPLFGQLRRNVPIRSSAGLGDGPLSVRFVGEVVDFAPRTGLAPADRRVHVKAAGIMRRLSVPGKSLLTAPRRFIPDTDPAVYWPLDDGRLSELGTPAVGSHPWAGFSSATDFGADLLAPWLGNGLSVHTEAGAVMLGDIDMSEGVTEIAVDHIRRAREGGTGPTVVSILPDTEDDPSGLQWFITIAPAPNETIGVALLDSGSLVNETVEDVPDLFDSEPHHIRFFAEQDGSDVAWALYLDGREVASNTESSRDLSPVRQVRMGYTPGSGREELVYGHIAVWGDNVPDLEDTVSAAFGHRGETTGRRVERLCDEEGVPLSTEGDLDLSSRMGPQFPGQFLELLDEAARVEAVGIPTPILTEQREAAGLHFITRRTINGRERDVVLDYERAHISEPFVPSNDDQQLANDVTVRRRDGREARAIDRDGPLGVDTIGRYDREHELNVENDEQLGAMAGWRLHHGAVTGALRRLAVHEAGHAVAHWALGHPWHSIELDETGGHVRFWFEPERWAVEDYLTATVAGAVAEEVAADGCVLLALEHGAARHDLAEARRYLAAVGVTFEHDQEVTEFLLDGPYCAALDLIEHHAALIDRVAAELSRNGRLTFERFEALTG